MSPQSGVIKLGSVGQVAPAVSLSIQSDRGEELPPGSEGRLWIKPRAVTVGYWGDPTATEALEHPSVASAGVIGIHDLVHGENVRAYITFTEGSEHPTSQELIRFARARVGYKAPEEIIALDKMPRTATGKLDRTALKRMAELNLAR